MSTLIVKTQKVLDVKPHPNADRLDLVTVCGWQLVTQKDLYNVGDLVVYIPPDSLITKELGEKLGVTNYLGNIPKNHELHGQYLKVKACMLRGEASYGIMAKPSVLNLPEEEDLDCKESLKIVKWEPPPELEKTVTGDNDKEHSQFCKYTDIENINNYPQVLEGLEVVVLEKVHGQNLRVGYVDSDRIKFRRDDLGVDVYHGMYIAGSHNCVKKQFNDWKISMHWKPLENENIRRLLFELRATHGKPVILFGEIFGAGLQDMDYGRTTADYLWFDIKVGAEFLDYDDKMELFNKYGLNSPPLLYRGTYDFQKIKELTIGPSLVGTSFGKFKGREGVVVTPVKEQYCVKGLSGHRLIFKSISADYLNRKNPTDSH